MRWNNWRGGELGLCSETCSTLRYLEIMIFIPAKREKAAKAAFFSSSIHANHRERRPGVLEPAAFPPLKI
jgi:hypothetical protein